MKKIIYCALLHQMALVLNVSASCDIQAPQTFDGSCNNLLNPTWGAAFETYSRGPEGAEFKDGVKEPVSNRPQPRVISNTVGDEDPSTAGEDPILHNMMAVMFGQFINHDFESNDREKLFERVFADDLLVGDDDQFCYANPFIPTGPSRCDVDGGPYVINYRKSAGSISSGQFEVTNRVTSYLDLSQVYGSTNSNATALRSMIEGKLLTEDYSGEGNPPIFPAPGTPWSFPDLPPSRATTGLNTDTLNLRYDDDEILTAGDFRINGNVVLAGFHTLFLREHNKLANEYIRANPGASDEEIFQAARRRNIAQYQHIVLEQYFPAEFGPYFTNILGSYSGYNPTVDATTKSVFSSCAFRYGHSAIRGFEARDKCGANSVAVIPPFLPPGSEVPNIGQVGGPFNILAFLYISGNVGFESIFRGLLTSRSRPMDTKVDDGIRNIYVPFSREGAVCVGVDVYSFDIQRGRLNGIPNYDRLLQAYHPEGSMYGRSGCGKGLRKNSQVDDPLSCFVRMVSGVSPENASPEELSHAATLKRMYGKINRMDGIIGLLSEPHVQGTSFGETLGRIVTEQYARARDGDRFWYENVYSPEDQAKVKQVTMKSLLERNFELSEFPDEVFLAPESFPVAAGCT